MAKMSHWEFSYPASQTKVKFTYGSPATTQTCGCRRSIRTRNSTQRRYNCCGVGSSKAQNTKSHWAFVAPERPAPPEVANVDWPKNAIDQFILRGLESTLLKPSPPADLRTLARRVSLDLTGLVPTTDELDRFLQDAERASADEAYGQLVDRLLAAPRYGERWARQWLDLARYADTNGYEKDQPRSIWPYRDWVINALNADMPFDQFTIEQLAGDMLPEASLSSRVASGFHRNTMLNEEGGIDPLEYRFYAMVDRVATTGTTWLGLTLGCAQCHTHKYDPISHQEYYQLMAFLNNANEPELALPDEQVEAEHDEQLRRADELVEQLPQHWPVETRDGESATDLTARKQAALDAHFDTWLQEQTSQATDWKTLTPITAESERLLLTIADDASVFVSGDATKLDTYRLTFLPTGRITAIRLEVLPDPRLPDFGPGLTYSEGTKGDFFLTDFSLQADGKKIEIAEATHSYAADKFGQQVSAALTIDDSPLTGWAVHGRIGQRHVAVYRLAEPLDTADFLQLQMVFGRHFSSSLGKFRIAVTDRSDPPQASDMPSNVEAALLLTADRRSSDQSAAIHEHFLLTAPELAEQAKEIWQLRDHAKFPKTLVMQERPAHHPRATHIHNRGEFLQPTTAVEAGVPAALHDFDAAWPRNRLGFAYWLTSPQNPLTARVVVNRHWAALFGAGLVAFAKRLWRDRHVAVASGTARLAGRRIRRERLVVETSAQADGYQRCLPPVFEMDRSSAGGRP